MLRVLWGSLILGTRDCRRNGGTENGIDMERERERRSQRELIASHSPGYCFILRSNLQCSFLPLPPPLPLPPFLPLPFYKSSVFVLSLSSLSFFLSLSFSLSLSLFLLLLLFFFFFFFLFFFHLFFFKAVWMHDPGYWGASSASAVFSHLLC